MKQSYKHLNLQERHTIQALRSVGLTAQQIGDQLGRSPSTISRELRRNSHPRKKTYDASSAEEVYKTRVRRAQTKPRTLDTPNGLAFIADVLKLMTGKKFSINQARVTVLTLGKHAFKVARQTIYRWMYSSTSMEAVSVRKAMTRPRYYARPRTGGPARRGRIPGMVSWKARPEGATNRSEPGHLEGDLVVSAKKKGALITLVDRKTRWATVIPVSDMTSDLVLGSVRDWASRQPAGAVKSITWDQGGEMSLHARFTSITGVPVFFADAHSPWQRGSNEHLNGIVRRHYPKGSVLPAGPADVARLIDALNTRPLAVLSMSTPEIVNSRLGSIALIP